MRRLAVAAMAVLLVACGGGDGGKGPPDDDPVLRPEDQVEVSKACQDAFQASHMREQTGEPTASAFLSSIEACSSLAEWSSAARSGGTRLNGQEPRFVYGICAAAPDPSTRSLPICQQAEVAGKPR
ncbi:MAG TPA: hypothetical protein VE760_03995 [Acidimicrobiales bacterium]|nr:hypothetical protein [Acidimicrobiales bacterium]